MCDFCDTQMDNEMLQHEHADVIKAQTEKMESLNLTIQKLDDEKDVKT